jgi:hypothetical protein
MWADLRRPPWARSVSCNALYEQRAIFNFTPSHQGFCPLGRMFTPSLTPRGKHYLLFRLMEWRTENFTSRDNFTPSLWGTTLPLGPKFARRGEVKNGPKNPYLIM